MFGCAVTAIMRNMCVCLCVTVFDCVCVYFSARNSSVGCCILLVVVLKRKYECNQTTQTLDTFVYKQFYEMSRIQKNHPQCSVDRNSEGGRVYWFGGLWISTFLTRSLYAVMHFCGFAVTGKLN